MIHDLGAASASLTMEATARGLCVHQMIGIEPDRAHEVFNVLGSLEPFTALAIGYAGDPSHLGEEYAKCEPENGNANRWMSSLSVADSELTKSRQGVTARVSTKIPRPTIPA